MATPFWMHFVITSNERKIHEFLLQRHIRKKRMLCTSPYRIFPATLSACLVAVGLTGCQALPGDTRALQSVFASHDPCADSSRNTGALVGGVLGAVAGALLSGKHSNDQLKAGAIGAGVGALLGGVIGHNIDQRRCELFKVAQANNLDLVVSDINVSETRAGSVVGPSSSQPVRVADSGKETAGLSVSIIDKGEQFAPGSAMLRPGAAKAMAALADTYRAVAATDASTQDKHGIEAQNKAMRILLVGHTDDTGSSQANADLSEARARAVARVFVAQGFSADQVFYQGAGETLPIADNHSEAGRARNRRVEVIDLSKDEAMAGYLANRKPVLAYYRGRGDWAASKAGSGDAARPKSSQTAALSTKTPVGQAKPVQEGAQAGRGSASNRRPATHSIDFGGVPVHGQYTQVSIGSLPTQKSAFSFLSAAHADESSIVGSCADDRPRISKGVKSLKSDKEAKFSTGDYLPGVYDASWVGVVNGHLVALTHVAVLRDGGSPARRPDLLVYANYSGDKKAPPTFSSTPEVNAYQGSDALLYRVFAGGPLQCMDIVIPNKNPRHAPNSNLVYVLGGLPYQAAFALDLAK